MSGVAWAGPTCRPRTHDSAWTADSLDPRDSPDPQDSRDPRDSLAPRDSLDSPDPQDSRDSRDSLAPRDSHDPREPLEPRNSDTLDSPCLNATFNVNAATSINANATTPATPLAPLAPVISSHPLDFNLVSHPLSFSSPKPANKVAGRRVHTPRLASSLHRPPRLSDNLETPNPDNADPCPRLHDHASSSGRPQATPVSPPPPCTSDPLFSPSILALNSSAAGDCSQRLLVVTVTVNAVPCRLLVDSGASRNFISHAWLKQHHIRPSNLRLPLRIRLADGTINATAQELPNATVNFTSDFSYCSSFVATALQGYDGILGKPFLADLNPSIDWSTNTITAPFNLPGDILQSPPVQIQLVTAKRMAKLIKKQPELLFYHCLVTQVNPDTPAPEQDPFSPATVLSPDNQRRLHHLLGSTHRSTFDEPSSVTHSGPLQRINLRPGSTPPNEPLRRMSPAELEELQRQLQIYLEKGWIRPSTSEYGAPILFAKKADGSLRLCIDYRQLNSITIKDRYPLPRSDELFDQLHGAKYFTSLDLWSGYHQTRIHPDDIHKTSFKTRFGSYEFLVLPFGLTNAPSAFMRLMHDVLRPYIDKFVVVYLDDVLIYSKDEQSHLDHVRAVLQAFDAANLKAKISKCSFAQASTRFLGYLVSPSGLSPDPKKVASVTDWPLPHDITSTRSFLGFTGFYRRFIKDYSKIAAPLTDLTKTTVPFPSTLPPAAIDSFSQLKAALLSAPLLVIPFTGSNATFELYTDASGIGIGAVLLQDQGNGPQPVCYESRKLTPAEKNYSVHEQELLAIVHAVKIFRHYLEGCKSFTVYTDHHSLKYFFTQRDLSRRQARWSQHLSPFQPNMSIVYRKGSENQADALSRLHTLFSISADSTPAQISLVSQVQDLLPAHVILADSILDDIKTAYNSDPYYAADNLRRPSFLQPRDGFWFFKDRICIPNVPSLRRRLLFEHHDAPTAGHLGYLKTLNSISSQFWWPRMTRTVRSYVSSCATCQRSKPSTQSPPGLLQPHAVPSRPWSHISMDLITDLPPSLGPDGIIYNSIVTFVCMLTKNAIFARAHKTVSARQLALLFIDHVFSKKGLPSVIVSDRDPRITSEFWQCLFKALGSKLNLSTAHHPQTDGQTEITHRTIEQILRAYVSPEHDDWATWLPVAEFAYNNAVHTSTHQTPFYANLGFNPTTPASFLSPANSDATNYLEHLRDIQTTIARELDLAKSQQAEQANRHRRPLSFSVGDRVRLSSDHIVLSNQPSSKLRSRYLGPFTVTAVISPVSYRLSLPPSMSRVHPVFHVSRLLPWTGNSDSDFPDREIPDQPIPDARDFVYGDNAYQVDTISDVKVATDPASRASPQAPCLFFYVKWSPPYHDPSHDSWEPLRLVSRLDALKAFLVSPIWQAFAATDEYKAFARKYKSKIPKTVHFNLADTLF